MALHRRPSIARRACGGLRADELLSELLSRHAVERDAIQHDHRLHLFELQVLNVLEVGGVEARVEPCEERPDGVKPRGLLCSELRGQLGGSLLETEVQILGEDGAQAREVGLPQATQLVDVAVDELHLLHPARLYREGRHEA